MFEEGEKSQMCGVHCVWMEYGAENVNNSLQKIE